MAKYFVGGGDVDALSKFTRIYGSESLSQVSDGGEDALAVTIPTSGTPSEHLFAHNDAGEFTNGDILVRYRMSSAVGSTQWDRGNGAFYRGDDASLTCYSSGARRVTLAAIYSQVSGTAALLASVNPGIGDNNIYKWYRSNFNGTALKLKVWVGTFADQPGTWTHEITNSAITAAGWSGIFAAATGSSSTVTHYWTHVGISDDPNDPAPHEPVGGGSAVASGALPSIGVDPAAGSASGSASVSAQLSQISISSASGSASGSAVASGNLSSVSLYPLLGAAEGNATAVGLLPSISITPPTSIPTFSGGAFNPNAFQNNAFYVIVSAVASGDLPSISITAATGSALPSVTATGQLPSISVSPPEAQVASSSVASGILPSLSLNPAYGSASGSVVAVGILPSISLTPAYGSMTVVYTWGDVDDGQDNLWVDVDDSQIDGWVDVDSQQASNWSNVNDSNLNTWVDVDDNQQSSWSSVL